LVRQLVALVPAPHPDYKKPLTVIDVCPSISLYASLLTEVLIRAIALLPYLPQSFSENIPTSKEAQAFRELSPNCDNLMSTASIRAKDQPIETELTDTTHFWRKQYKTPNGVSGKDLPKWKNSSVQEDLQLMVQVF